MIADARRIRMCSIGLVREVGHRSFLFKAGLSRSWRYGPDMSRDDGIAEQLLAYSRVALASACLGYSAILWRISNGASKARNWLNRSRFYIEGGEVGASFYKLVW